MFYKIICQGVYTSGMAIDFVKYFLLIQGQQIFYTCLMDSGTAKKKKVVISELCWNFF